MIDREQVHLREIVRLDAERLRTRQEVDRLRAALTAAHGVLARLRDGRWEMGYVHEQVDAVMAVVRSAMEGSK